MTSDQGPVEDRLRRELAAAAELAPVFDERAFHGRASRAGSRRTRGARVAVLASVAAVLVLAVGTWALSTPQPGSDGVPAGRTSGLPAPGDGLRWVSWHDLAVRVPAEWGYGREPHTDWCLDPKAALPTGYVALGPAVDPVFGIGCGDPDREPDPVFGPAPESRWAPHVALGEPDGPDGTWRSGPWQLTVQTVRGVQVRVLSQDPDQAGDILATARTIAVDGAGCAVSSPIQTLELVRPAPVDLGSLGSVDEVSVCHYDRSRPATDAGLVGSRRLSGAAATDYQRALTQAPVGGGPGDQPDCSASSEYRAGTAIVVRLWSDGRPHDLYAYYDWCQGIGVDDGRTRRAFTRATCAPLFAEPPVVAFVIQQSLLDLCLPDRA